jgi:TonB family protein
MIHKSLIAVLPFLLMISCTNENSPDVVEFIACADRDAPVEVIKATSGPLFSNGEIVKENAGEYPEMARRAKIEGIVEISFQINESGEALDVHITKGIGGGADETSLNAVKNSQFIPAKFKSELLCIKTKAQALFDLENPDNVVLTLDSE